MLDYLKNNEKFEKHCLFYRLRLMFHHRKEQYSFIADSNRKFHFVLAG